MKPETFKGYVVQIEDDNFFVEVEDSSGGREIWRLEKKMAPEIWLRTGAAFQVEIGEDGLRKWTFDMSSWTARSIRKLNKAAKALARFLFKKQRPACRKR